jgi:diguanylate cyclase (GGDEF)-like protein
MERELAEMASTDPLTGISNRRVFIARVELELSRLKRNNTANPSLIIMLDIDHFKKINDSFGHDAGDLVLKYFSQLLNDRIRSTDMVARLGGEEFVVVLSDTTIRNALEWVEGIRKEVQSTQLDYMANKIQFTFSGGITSLHPDMATVDVAIKKADQALYKAKEQGRNRILVTE